MVLMSLTDSLVNFTSVLTKPFDSVVKWLSALYDFVISTIDSIILAFEYIGSSGRNVLFYNSFVPSLFGGVIVAFVVVAIVKAIFGR